MERRIAVRGIVLHEGKLLAAQLKRYKGTVFAGISDNWCIPGGGLEAGESIMDGIRREMLEETGIEPAIGGLLYVQQFAYKGTEHLEFFFHITNGADYLSINLSKTTHGEREIAEIGFRDPAAIPILPEFLRTDDLAAVVARGSTRIISRL